MSVEVWYGEKPRNPAEQKTLLELYQYLHPQQEHFVILHNFFAGQSNEIDLVVLKQDGIFLAELKHVWDTIVGGREGDWKAIRHDGTEVVLNPGRPNPFKQARRNYYGWKGWCQDHAEKIGAGLTQPCSTDWADVMTYIVCYPELPAGSTIDIGEWPVQAVGLSEFLPALVVRLSNKVRLSYQEMSCIPQLLGLQQWQLSPPPETSQATKELQPTEKLEDWRPSPFAVLVARGHTLSAPIFRLDEIHKEAITVGRETDNDLIIGDPTVSRHHAEIYRSSGRWVVCDLNSTSGTFLSFSGEPAPAKESRVQGRDFALKNNSIVRFGPAAYTFLLYESKEP